MKIKRKVYLSILIFMLIAICQSENVYAAPAWQTDPVAFITEFGEQNAMYKDGYFWFAQKGLKATTGTKYKILGFKITVTSSGKTYNVSGKIGSSIKEVKEVVKNDNGREYKYTLWKMSYNTLLTKLENSTSASLSKIADPRIMSNYVFNAYTTLSVNGVDKGDITDDGKKTGTVYTTAKDIQNAAAWDTQSKMDMVNLYDIFVPVTPPSPSVSVGKVTMNSTSESKSTVYKKNASTYYVKTNSSFTVQYDSTLENVPDMHVSKILYNLRHKNKGFLAASKKMPGSLLFYSLKYIELEPCPSPKTKKKIY